MKPIHIYQVDAFTDKLFGGNPAAVCILDKWMDDELLQAIAMENNLPETAFVIPGENRYQIRWFSPSAEVDLCGHATLASGYVVFNHLGFSGEEITFFSPRSGELKVVKDNGALFLDFPVDIYTETEPSIELINGLKLEPLEVYKGKTDFLVVIHPEEKVLKLNPDFYLLAGLEGRGVIVTAQGKEVDFVSRFFAPGIGIPEDPVTGSAHTTMIPYWSKRLKKKKMSARQLSARGGTLVCEDHGDRVRIGGEAQLYLKGEIFIHEM